jgi:hypothetical protein
MPSAIGFSMLDEVWQMDERPARKRSKSSQKGVDPLTQLYNKRAAPMSLPYAEDSNGRDREPTPFMRRQEENDVYEPYRKIHPESEGVARDHRNRVEPSQGVAPVQHQKQEDIQRYIEENEDDLVPRQTDHTPEAQQKPTTHDNQPRAPAASLSPARPMHDKFFDFGLYIAGGIILIFLMDRILSLGMRMKPAVDAVSRMASHSLNGL